jgi:hypothetical protein
MAGLAARSRSAATELRLTQRNSPSNRKTIGFGINEAACPSGGGEGERAVQARLGERDEQGWNVKIVAPEPIYEARKGEKAERTADLNLETRRNGRMPRARFRRVRL